MIIGVQRGLDEIKNYLEAVGSYIVRELEDCNGEEAVMIYKEIDTEKTFKNYQFEALKNSLAHKEEDEEGILIINAVHQTPQAISRLLNEYFDKK